MEYIFVYGQFRDSGRKLLGTDAVLRYCDPNNNVEMCSKENYKQVDVYVYIK